MGKVRLMLETDQVQRLYRELKRSRITVRELSPCHEGLVLIIPWEQLRRVRKILDKMKISYSIMSIGGPAKLASEAKGYPGIILSTLMAVPLMIYYSNVVITLEVQTDKPQIRREVIQVLRDQGICPGTYIPDIDYAVAERELRKRVSGISWAGISRTGAGLSVDIIEVIPEAPSMTRGMPCDLVASETGVIDKLEVYDGQVVRGSGCGVVKGDVIVSGTVVQETSQWVDEKELVDRQTSWVKSIGKAYGTFERTVDFYQPYQTEVTGYTGRTRELNSLLVFSSEIPLFKEVPEGSWEQEEQVKFPEIKGFRLPVGIRTIKLKEYTNAIQWTDKEEAQALAGEQAYRYEQNFLKEYELLDRSTEFIEEDEGLTLRVTYELYGVMSREREFFIPKDITDDEDEKS